MKRHWYMIYFGLIIGGLFTLGITMFIRPAKHFSENENRVLQQIPTFSLNSFVQGQYQEKLEKGADDQFPGRDGLTATASICKRMMGQKDIGDTYLGKDHYYLAKKTEDSIDMFRYMENLRYVEYVGSQRASKSTLLLVPDAGTILADKLPAQAPFYQAAALYRAAGSVCKQTTFVDIRQAMNEQKKSEQLYYRTDHHWTLAKTFWEHYIPVCLVQMPKQIRSMRRIIYRRSLRWCAMAKKSIRSMMPVDVVRRINMRTFLAEIMGK